MTLLAGGLLACGAVAASHLAARMILWMVFAVVTTLGVAGAISAGRSGRDQGK
jgi:hypothetical protein